MTWGRVAQWSTTASLRAISGVSTGGFLRMARGSRRGIGARSRTPSGLRRPSSRSAVVPLVLSSIFFFEIDVNQGEALQEHVLCCCLAGLADVGSNLDPRQLRFGYAATSLRYQFGDMNLPIGAVLDEAYHYVFPPIFDRSVTECVDGWAT